MTFETVGTDTPACRAMSAIVVWAGRRRGDGRAVVMPAV